jgi:hypothetical protein
VSTPCAPLELPGIVAFACDPPCALDEQNTRRSHCRMAPRIAWRLSFSQNEFSKFELPNAGFATAVKTQRSRVRKFRFMTPRRPCSPNGSVSTPNYRGGSGNSGSGNSGSGFPCRLGNGFGVAELPTLADGPRRLVRSRSPLGGIFYGNGKGDGNTLAEWHASEWAFAFTAICEPVLSTRSHCVAVVS